MTGEILGVLPEPDHVNRKRYKTAVRETENGVVEIDHDDTICNSSNTSSKVNPPDRYNEDPAPTERKDVTSTSTIDALQSTDSKKDPTPSTTSDWTSYAGQPGRFEVGVVFNHPVHG